MDFKKLFETQATLEAMINEKHPVADGENRLADKVLAIQVELGECAKEWRGFKFWSNDQEPRTVRKIETEWDDDGTPTEWLCNEDVNPLLEEYVDVLHFALSIGLEIGVTMDKVYLLEKSAKTITERFSSLMSGYGILATQPQNIESSYRELFAGTIRLGIKLGFTLEEIEQAYYAKNTVNHHRQAVGY